MWYRSVTLAGGIVLSAAAVGCHSWKVQEVAPESVLEQQHPSAVEVHHRDGSKFRLQNPSINQDTLIGTRSGSEARVPLDQVAGLGVRRFSAGRTTLLVLSIPAGLFGLAAVGCATSNCGY
jgi:hypothetical protein